MFESVKIGDSVKVNVGTKDSMTDALVIEKIPEYQRIVCELVHPDQGDKCIGEFKYAVNILTGPFPCWTIMCYRNRHQRSIPIPTKEKSTKTKEKRTHEKSKGYDPIRSATEWLRDPAASQKTGGKN